MRFVAQVIKEGEVFNMDELNGSAQVKRIISIEWFLCKNEDQKHFMGKWAGYGKYCVSVKITMLRGETCITH